MISQGPQTAVDYRDELRDTASSTKEYTNKKTANIRASVLETLNEGQRSAANQVIYGTTDRPVGASTRMMGRRDFLQFPRGSSSTAPTRTRSRPLKDAWNEFTTSVQKEREAASRWLQRHGDRAHTAWNDGADKVKAKGQDLIQSGSKYADEYLPDYATKWMGRQGDRVMKFGRAAPLIDLGIYGIEAHGIYQAYQQDKISAEEARIRAARLVSGAGAGYVGNAAGASVGAPFGGIGAPIGAVLIGGAAEYATRRATDAVLRNPYRHTNSDLKAAMIESYVKWDWQPMVNAVQNIPTTLQNSASIKGISPYQLTGTARNNSTRKKIVQMKREMESTHSVEAGSSGSTTTNTSSSGTSHRGELPIEPLLPTDTSTTGGTDASSPNNRAKANKRARADPKIVNQDVRVDPASLDEVHRRIDEVKQEAVREVERRIGSGPTMI